MGMGRREKQRSQEKLWIAHRELPRTVAHPFYEQLNRVLEGRGFDRVCRSRMRSVLCGEDGAAVAGAGAVFPFAADRLFRRHRWRARDRMAGSRIRWGCAVFSGVGLDEMPPDHSTISRTRRLIDVETHQAVFELGAEAAGRDGSAEGKDDGGGCDDAWRPTRRCARSCGATRARAIRSF